MKTEETLKKQIEKLKTGDIFFFENFTCDDRKYCAIYLGNLKYFIFRHTEPHFNNRFFDFSHSDLNMTWIKISLEKLENKK